MRISYTINKFNIIAGNFFFRWRNTIFPVAIIIVVFFTRPIHWMNPSISQMCVVGGIVIMMLGQMVRFFTIGFDYIDRGGRNNQVYASRLVQRGVYGITRNPMYIGNILILVGFCVAAGSREAYAFVIPAFVYVYWAIICAEEKYLFEKYSDEYTAYCRQVNRFVPSIRHIRYAMSGFQYDWQRTIKQEIGTLFGILQGIIFLFGWRVYFLAGTHVLWEEIPEYISFSFANILLYLLVVTWKKNQKLSFYSKKWFKYTSYVLVFFAVSLILFSFYYEIAIEPRL